MIHRYDGSTYYMLFSGTSNGSWNSLRPLSIPFSTGYVGINNAAPAYTLDVGGTVNATTLQGNLAYSYLTSIPSVLSNTSTAYTFSCNAAVSASNSVNGAISCTSIVNSGNLTVSRTVQTGLSFPASDPGMFYYTKYSDPKDYYGFGQFPLGTVRAVISGFYSAATFKVCKPSNSNLLSFTDLMTVDASTATCTASNFTSLNLITTPTLSVSGTSTFTGAATFGTVNATNINNSAGNITFKYSTASNLTLYTDGSAGFRGGVAIGTAQISSNVFAGDATYSHINNHNSTGFAITQSSGGLTTVIATAGNAVRTGVNGTLTASFSTNSFAIGTDSLNIPGYASVGTTPVVLTQPGGYSTFSGLQWVVDTSLIWGGSPTNSTALGEIKLLIKSCNITYPVSCMLTLGVSRLNGQQATLSQISFMNNGCSVANFSATTANTIVINMNSITDSPQLYGNYVYTGIL